MGTRLETDTAPYYETHIFVCCNSRPEGHKRGDCASKGADKIRNYMKARVKELGLENIRVNQSGCLDRCELGPCAVFYPEGVWYKLDSFAAVDAVIEQHLQQQGRVNELLLP